jgi:hypothetical protein
VGLTWKVPVHFFQNLTVGYVQLDEWYTTLRDKAHDVGVWVAFDPASKLIPALQLGPRTQDVAYALLHALSQVLAPGCLPAFTRDGLNLYFYATLAPARGAGVTAHPSAALRTSFRSVDH